MGKKYKLWEMLKAFEENPNRVFVAKSSGFGTRDMYIHWENGRPITDVDSNLLLANRVMEFEYELVREETTFIEALKAYKSGKEIICELVSCGGIKNTTRYKREGSSCVIKDSSNVGISYPEILDGRWFIGEQNE